MALNFLSPTVQDLDQLVNISIKTFRDTFEKDNDPAELECYLTTAFSPLRLKQLLEASNYHFWFLETNGEIAGYFALKDAPPSDKVFAEHPIEIARFYLDTAYQGVGLGHLMMAYTVEQTKHFGADMLWLGVWEKNLRAQHFYQKQGFHVFGQQHFWVGNDCQTDHLMQRKL